jgi:hypothetical protein
MNLVRTFGGLTAVSNATLVCCTVEEPSKRKKTFPANGANYESTQVMRKSFDERTESTRIEDSSDCVQIIAERKNAFPHQRYILRLYS